MAECDDCKYKHSEFKSLEKAVDRLDRTLRGSNGTDGMVTRLGVLEEKVRDVVDDMKEHLRTAKANTALLITTLVGVVLTLASIFMGR